MKTLIMTLKDKCLPDRAEVPAEVVMAIVKAVKPERIICFGIRSLKHQSWSAFLSQAETREMSVYDLLILTRVEEKRDRHELLNTLDCLNSDTHTTSSLIHNVDTVREALAEESPFFTSVFKNGISLYENASANLCHALIPIRIKDLSSVDEARWKKNFGLATHFLQGAREVNSRGSYDLAIFMLHQAVEHSCIAMIRLITGYRATTHNLSRLIAITENFTGIGASVFPRNTREEKELFRLLARAYIDARYCEEFTIDASVIKILIERASTILAEAERLYRHRHLSPPVKPLNPLEKHVTR